MKRLFGCAKRRILLVLLFTANCSLANEEVAAERVVWDKRPIAVHIQRDQERIIHFPDDVRYWLPDTLKRKVSVVAANGVLYIRALEAFPATRIRVQGLADQQIYLLDVIADDSASVSDELIVVKPESVKNRAKSQASPQHAADWRVRLTRYAAQQLYAPERLLQGDSQIKRIPIEASQAVPLVRGQSIEAIPIAAWQGGGLTVTAIRLRNITEQPRQLAFVGHGSENFDLARALRGDWLTAAVQHHHLGGVDSETDTTTLYLVSNRPFAESLGFVVVPADEFEEATDG